MDRLRLKERRFAVLGNDCVGAELYRHFGLPYLSPFVGLFVPTPDYLRLLADPQRYLAAGLEFVAQSRYPEYADGGTHYPLGLLGDVEIHFLHYDSEAAAREAWTRRLARVDPDRLVAVLTLDAGKGSVQTLAEFERLPVRKLCLVAEDWPLTANAVRLPKGSWGQDSRAAFEMVRDRIDVVRWLNGAAVHDAQRTILLWNWAR